MASWIAVAGIPAIPGQEVYVESCGDSGDKRTGAKITKCVLQRSSFYSRCWRLSPGYRLPVSCVARVSMVLRTSTLASSLSLCRWF